MIQVGGLQLKSRRKQQQQVDHNAIGSQTKPRKPSVRHCKYALRLWPGSLIQMNREDDKYLARSMQTCLGSSGHPADASRRAGETLKCRERAAEARLSQQVPAVPSGCGNKPSRGHGQSGNSARQDYATTIVAALLSSLIILLAAFGQPARGLQLQAEHQSAIIGRHHNNVIPLATSTTTTTATARLGAQLLLQQPQQQTAHPQPLPFKYHLNHLNPPSLVPITIEQQQHLGQQASLAPSAGQQHDTRPLQQLHHHHHQPASWRRWAQEQASGLVQLQLPLQLHLKLKPLPLPMPPPPPPVASTAPESRRSSNEKRRRSLLEHSVSEAKATSTTTTTTLSPVETTTPPPEHKSRQDNERAERERRNLMALTWREAKRVLLLSSMMSSPAISQVERRSARLDLANNNMYKPATAAEIEQPANDNLLTQPVEDSSTLAAESRQFSTANDQPPPPPPTTTAASPAAEVRRQRHSSQQQLQGQVRRPEPDADATTGAQAIESRFQALAAAMLPLFWPSFQATSPATRLQALSLTGSSGAKLQSPGWPLKVDQIARQQSATAASSPAPSFAVDPASEPPTTPRPPTLETTTRAAGLSLVATSTTTPIITTTRQPTKLKSRSLDRLQPTVMAQPERTTRKRRRKPTYLAGMASTGYPDSTRLASKYPMPRLKFGQSSTPPPSPTTMNPNAEPSEHKKATSPGQGLPKSLSKIIEQQLLLNATSLLQQHKLRSAGQLLAHLAPSTSVSKLVRLRNDTEMMQVVKTTSTTNPLQLNRLNASSTTPKPQLSTTLMPPTSTRLPLVLATTTVQPSSTIPPRTTTTTVRPTSTSSTTEQPSSTARQLEEDKLLRPTTAAWSSEAGETDDEVSKEPKTTSTERPAIVQKPMVGGKKFGSRGKLKANQSGARSSNIKLFHFKRKPDFNKLPFYKKPLNYTELGWTPEQIQEHLESIGFMLDASGNAVAKTADQDGSGEPSVGEQQQLLKRKRRGKSQFERLMAELHGPQSTTTTLPPVTTTVADNEAEPAADKSGPTGGEIRVPLLLSKKTTKEPLVMKPMFFVMNQKRRPNSNQTEPMLSPNKQPVASKEAELAEVEPSTQVAVNKSKPIIRMRRKHHGEQPVNLLSASEQQTPWRPSKPAQMQHQLMLVPSGLLTPSGSHLMPLFTSALERPAARREEPALVAMAGDQQSARLVSELFANWRPTGWREPKPSGGLAPSGEESFLQAPSSPALTQSLQSPSERIVLVASSSQSVGPMQTTERNSQTDQQQQQPRALQLGEQVAGQAEQLRVPKLLSKPMRPAKYSLNGYIPKPSLGQQQSTAPVQASPATSSALAANPNASQQKVKKQRPPVANTGAHLQPAGQGKDLDSSTSNEIFSRRRGLQQHLRSQSQAAESGRREGLLPANAPKSDQQMMSLAQRQMEEKKRKYILQQQLALKSTTLSVQKANQIKAKLGLVVSNSTHHPRPSASSDSNQQASTTSVLTSDPSAGGELNAATAAQLGGLIGAPLNSIPKTDFECTDKRGKFVSGLFADHKTGCQVWHLCSNNRKYSFLCPSGTIFNAKLRICDWRYNVKCESSAPF